MVFYVLSIIFALLSVYLHRKWYLLKAQVNRLSEHNQRLLKSNKKFINKKNIIDKLPDRSYIINTVNTFNTCKRCKSKGEVGSIHETRRFRLRENEDNVWLNTLLSSYHCSNCNYKNISLKNLVKYSEDKNNNNETD
jgi:hypothetical protein